MDMLKKIWPFSFNAKNDVAALVINIIIHVVGMVILGLVGWVIGLIPVLGGILAGIIGTVGGLYLIVGIVLSVLDYLKVLK